MNGKRILSALIIPRIFFRLPLFSVSIFFSLGIVACKLSVDCVHSYSILVASLALIFMLYASEQENILGTTYAINLCNDSVVVPTFEYCKKKIAIIHDGTTVVICKAVKL